ncbi:MAG: hypothetical protein DHS20C01_13130 [marine bacterium B5-7]|nr:MAG: hypothetical protein DHS20C01_13130 [marine bacterium B5-7]
MHSVRLGLYFIAFTTLLLELTLIRIFDHLWFPNMAYMVITLAMFSIGVSGVIVSLKPIDQHRRFWVIIAILAVAMAIACYVILPVLNDLQFNYKHIGKYPVKALQTFMLILTAIATPFLISGLIISAIFSRFADKIQSLYFWDLIGAASGCVAILLAVQQYGAPGLLILCAATALIAASFFIPSRILSLIVLALAVAVGLKPLLRDKPYDIAPHMNKRGFANYYYSGKIETSVWDPVSSIDIVDYRGGIKWIAYDGGTQTSYYYKFDGDYDALRKNIEKLKTIQFWGPMVLVSHYLKANTDSDVLVIGAAGGQETKAALLYGAKHVDAVELVGSVVELAKTRYAEWTGNIYNDPRVNAVRGEGRSFLRGTNHKYDIIQMMSNHTSSSLAAGSGAISPVYLQTVEAYKEYFQHLKKDGILHINHHLFPRMMAAASRAWEELGLTNFRDHVLVVESSQSADNLPTTLISMTPWTSEDLARAESFLNYNNTFHTVVHPSDPEKNYLPDEFFTGEISAKTIERVPYRISAPTDDKPFFNFIRKSLAIEQIDDSKYVNASAAFLLNKRREAGFPLDVLHLFVTGGASILFALIVLGVPMLFSRTGREKWQGKMTFMGYFACLGAGFIIIELVLIQVFMKLIGFPTYTYATAVFSMLLGAGLGSAFSSRLDFNRLSSLRKPFMAVLITIGILLITKDMLFNFALTWSLGIRMLIASLMLVPVGFFLGMPFPIGISLARFKPQGTVAWCWAMNGLCTIVGGLLSVVLSLYLGFTLTIIAASMLYLLAMLLLGRMFHVTEPVNQAT